MGNLTKSANTANDPRLGPIFNFIEYKAKRNNEPFHNNKSEVDFVTYNGSLYVCVQDGTLYKSGDPANNGFLLLVKQGKDGRPGVDGKEGPMGPMPNYTLKFVGKQLYILDQNGVAKAVSPELTGPAWFPELRNHTIVWTRKEADDGSIPQDINLDEIKPAEEQPLLLRLNSDNTKRSDEETGPGYYIQWKREGNEHWTNLMSISELMNIALAGVSFWWDDAMDGSTDIEGNPIQTLHFGHRQVQSATYDASKLGNKRIAEVELGDVLFDAGEVPFKNYDDDIAALHAFLCDIQNQLNNIEIPDNISYFRNDVPYIKTINGERPNDRGEFKIKDLDNIPIAGDEGNIPFATINGRPIINTDANFEIPSDYLTENQLKTVGGQSLIKTAGNTNVPLRTINGNSIIGSTDLSVGTVKSVSVNGGTHVTPDSNGNVNLTVSGGSGGSGSADGVGVDNIEFKLDGTLQYRVSINGSWHSWTNIPLPSGTSGSGEHVDLQITPNNVLQIRYNGGSWQDIGFVNSGGGSGNTINGFVSVTRNENTLIFTRQDGTTQSVTIPTGGESSSVSIQQILSSGTRIATITINGVSTDIYAPAGGGGGGDGSGSGSGDGGAVVTYNTFMVYQRTNSPTEAPSTNTITSATWNSSNNTFTLVSQYWHDHPGNMTGQNDSCLWMTMATFRSDTGSRVGDWSDPICLTSRFGDGADSQLKEFIYRSVADAEYSAVIAVRPVGQSNDNTLDDNLPASDNLAIRQWVDTPIGITQEYPYELCSYRRKIDGVWSQYSMPFVWSRWGEDGVDGAGVEYVFRRAVASEVDESNGSITLKSTITRPNNNWAYDSPVSPWTDEPSGVNSSYPYEFCSLRKTLNGNDISLNSTPWGSWSEPALWSIYKEGPQGQAGVDVVEQTRYYKASAEATGVTAPATNADPTLSANGGWLTSSNTISLTSETPYLWFFERIVYTNGRIWQSVPVIIRYLNAAAQVNYQEIISNVETAIQDDLDALDSRLDSVEGNYAIQNLDSENALISAVTGYTDGNNKSFADIIIDGKEAQIKQWAGAEINSELSTAGTTLNGMQASITNSATKAYVDGKVSDARTEWEAGDAAITSTVTNATYVWVNNTDGSMLPYDGASSKYGYTKTLIATEMSAIKQTSDAVSILVGQDGNVDADFIISAINGGTARIDANHIVLNGETIATAIQAAEISANQITSGTINANRIASNSITADKIAAGAITAEKLAAGAITVDDITIKNSVNGMSVSEFGGAFRIGTANSTEITTAPNDCLLFII